MEDHVLEVTKKFHAYALQADERATPAESAMAINYLDAFGYFSKALQGWKDVNLGDVVNAVVKFQDFFGLAPTGQLTPQTVRTMEYYRCGFPDHVQPHHVEYMKIKAYADTQLPHWRKNGISYCVQDYVSSLGKQAQDQIIDQAFQQWMDICGVQLRRANPGEPCDILVSTGQGQRSNFDGPGGVLAWAYMPDGSDQQLLMRFDLDETWVSDPTQRGIMMLNVACHEFGHLLGLDHSRTSAALMAPYYNVSIAKPQENDDVPRVVARYGPPVKKPVAPDTPAVTPDGKHTVIITGDINLTVVGPMGVSVDGKQVV